MGTTIVLLNEAAVHMIHGSRRADFSATSVEEYVHNGILGLGCLELEWWLGS